MKNFLISAFLVLTVPAIAQVPTITDFNPKSAKPGDSITITGTNFSATPASNTVFFGTVKGVVTVSSTTQLTVTVPIGALARPLTVRVSGLQVVSNLAFTPQFSGAGNIQSSSFTAATLTNVVAYNYTADYAADFDGDGKLDVISAATNTYNFQIQRNISTVGTVSESSLAAPVQVARVSAAWPVFYGSRVADIDGDGKLDIVGYGSNDKILAVHRNTSTSGNISFSSEFEIGGAYPAFGTMQCVPGLSDLDGDGKIDVFMPFYDADSKQKVSYHRNTSTPGNFSFDARQTKVIGLGHTLGTPAAGDVDGDGKPDLAFISGTYDSITILLNSSTTGSISFSSQLNLYSSNGNNATAVFLHDMDLDGKLDLISSNTNGSVRQVRVWRNTSATPGVLDASSFAAPVDYNISDNAFIVSIDISDLSGDGKPDIVAEATSYYFFQNQSTPGVINSSSFKNYVQTGTAGYQEGSITAADIDGDGKPDLMSRLYARRNIILPFAPTITSFTPTEGPVGTEVTLIGTRMSAVTSADVGGTAVTDFSIVNDSSMTIIIPDNALTGNITVTNAGGQGVSIDPFTVLALPPSVPQDPSATAVSSSQINLGWTKSQTGAPTKYRVLRSMVSGSGYVQIDSVNAPTVSYNNTGLNTLTQYFYVIQAVNANGGSAYTFEVFATTFGTPPSVPTNLNATAASLTQIDLSWTASTGSPTGYRIYRSLSSGGPFTQIDSVGVVTSYSNTGLTSGTQYFYKISAYSQWGASAQSATASATSGSLPSVPSGLTATAISQVQIDLSWNSSTGSPTRYRIYRSTTSGSGFAQIDSVTHPTLAYSSIGLSSNTTYYYKISSVNVFGSSNQSAEQSATTLPDPPAAPTNLSATTMSTSRIDLSWSASTGNPAKYRIYRSTTSGSGFTQVDSVISPTVTYSSTGLASNTTYYYIVRGVNNGGASDPSNQANATTDGVAPSTPTNLSANTASSSQINLSWTASTDSPERYRIYRSLTSGNGFTQIDSVSHPTVAYNNSGLTANTQYFYKISAVNVFGVSSLTSEQSTTTLPLPPAVPTSLTATAVSTSQINLGWTASTGSPTRYRIYSSSTSGSGFSQIDSVTSPTVTYSVTGLQPNTTRFLVVTAINAGGASAFSNEASATSLPLAPTFGQVNYSPTTVNENQTVTVTAVVNNGPTVVRLIYGLSSETTGDSVAMTLNTGTWSGTIPANKVTSAGLWYRVKAGNLASTIQTNRTNIAVSVSSASINATISNGSYPAGLNTKKFYTFSLPFSSTLNLESVFGQQEFGETGLPTNWKATTYSPATGQYTSVTTLTGNQAYFIRQNVTGNIFSFLTSGSTNGPDAFKDITLPAVQGWNLIVWPHAYTTNVTVTGTGQIGSIWQLNNGSWEAVTQLKPFGGYAVYNKTSNTVRLGDVLTLTAAKTAVNNNLVWRMKFSSQAGSFKDEFNFIGIADTAMEYYDVYDEVEPMAMDEYLRTSFKINHQNKNVDLANDIRPLSEDGHVWDMQVEHNTKETIITLRWEDLGLPSGFDAIMVDVHHNKTINLKQQNEYTFKPRSQNPFKILVGNPQFIQSKTLDLEKSLPKEFALSQNYPNPFNPETTIRYAIARTGRISLRVYNILGQEVRTLVSGVKETGIHEVTWDGKNNLGQSVASGIYIYRLEAGSFSRTKKLMFVK